MSIFFSKMLDTLAVIMVIAAFIGGSELFGKFFNTDEKWKYIILASILGGGFGIYGTISGITMQRDPGRHVHGSEQFDDITMLCLEYK